MIQLRVEVGEGQPTKKQTGFMHQLTIKNDQGYQCIRMFNENQLQPGVYEVTSNVQVTRDRDNFEIYQLRPDLRTLKAVK